MKLFMSDAGVEGNSADARAEPQCQTVSRAARRGSVLMPAAVACDNSLDHDEGGVTRPAPTGARNKRHRRRLALIIDREDSVVALRLAEGHWTEGRLNGSVLLTFPLSLSGPSLPICFFRSSMAKPIVNNGSSFQR